MCRLKQKHSSEHDRSNITYGNCFILFYFGYLTTLSYWVHMVQHDATIQRKKSLSLKNTVYIGHYEALLKYFLARKGKGWQSCTLTSNVQRKWNWVLPE